jgi:dienelactone hydrolase
MEKLVRIARENAEPINFHVRSGKKNKMPLVIVSHGFKGFKEWGFLPYLSEQLAKAGALVFTQDFSLNGILVPETRTYDIEKFSKNTISVALSDLQCLIEYANQHYKDIFSGEVYLFGHSLGGGISIVAGSNFPEVTKVAVWGSISTFDRYSHRQKEIWKKRGVMEFNDQTTGETFKIDICYLNDLEEHESEYDILSCIEKLGKPLLILHGTTDVTVRAAEAERMYNASNKKLTNLVLQEKTNHTFGVVHPFTVTNEQLEKAIKITLQFLGLDE